MNDNLADTRPFSHPDHLPVPLCRNGSYLGINGAGEQFAEWSMKHKPIRASQLFPDLGIDLGKIRIQKPGGTELCNLNAQSVLLCKDMGIFINGGKIEFIHGGSPVRGSPHPPL